MATQEDEIPFTEDLTGTCWRDDVWLSRVHGLLSAGSVLEYISGSPFWDLTSLNDVARKQGLSLAQLPAGTPGIEYVLQDSQPPHLFVIHKLYKRTTGERSLLAMYYVLDGTVYQAPNVYDVFTSRLERCMHSLKMAFYKLRADLNPMIGAEIAKDSSSYTQAITSEIEKTQWRHEHGFPAPFFKPNRLYNPNLLGDRNSAPTSMSQAAVARAGERSQRVAVATMLDHPLPLPSAVWQERNIGGGLSEAPSTDEGQKDAGETDGKPVKMEVETTHGGLQHSTDGEAAASGVGKPS